VIVGVISDTHGLLRPEAVTALRGNNDKGPWARAIAETQVVDAGGVLIYVIHDVAELDVDPAAGVRGEIVTLV